MRFLPRRGELYYSFGRGVADAILICAGLAAGLYIGVKQIQYTDYKIKVLLDEHLNVIHRKEDIQDRGLKNSKIVKLIREAEKTN